MYIIFSVLVWKRMPVLSKMVTAQALSIDHQFMMVHWLLMLLLVINLQKFHESLNDLWVINLRATLAT